MSITEYLANEKRELAAREIAMREIYAPNNDHDLSLLVKREIAINRKNAFNARVAELLRDM